MSGTKNCLIVLGMHRSGTSALMGVLYKLGVPIGSKFLTGLYENPVCVDFNEKLLSNLWHGWDDLGKMEQEWWRDPAIERFKHELADLILDEYGRYEFWGLKEPRICLTLPVWLTVLNHLGIHPMFIIPFRNPLEIAASHANRDGFSPQKSITLWMKYILAAEYYSRGFQRIFLRFADLLIDPQRVLNRIAQAFGIQFPLLWDQAEKDIKGFLNPNLRRHNILALSGMGNFPEEFQEAAALFDQACEEDSRPEDQAHEFDMIRNRFQKWQSVFINPEIRDTQEKIHALRQNTFKHLNDYGRHLISQRHLGAASALYQDVVRLFPQSPVAWNNLGIIYENSGETDHAIDCFKKAVAIDRNYTFGSGNLQRLMASRNPQVKVL